MTGLLLTGLIKKFYDDAKSDDIEYKASAFWQVVLQAWFSQVHDFAVVCEYSPDEGRSRTDITVLKYDPNHHTLAILNVVEAKRKGNSPKEAEKDALLSALKAVDKYNLMAIYAMTTWGTSFRIWVVDATRRELEPVDEGVVQLGHKLSYIDAADPRAQCFIDAVRLMKDEPALRRAPIVPSQAHLMGQVPSQLHEGVNAQTAQAGGGLTFTPEVGNESGSAGQTVPLPNTSSARRKEKIVQLKRVKHLTGHDELFFKRGDSQQLTRENEWEWVPESGLYRWNRSRGTDYYTKSLGK